MNNTKEQLIKEIKIGFKKVEALQRKRNAKFLKILPKFSVNELKEISENDLEIWILQGEIDGNKN